MLRFAALARTAIGFIFFGLIGPIVVRWATEHPSQTAEGVMGAIYWFASLPWVYPAALVAGGATAGAWLDWLLRRLDGSRARGKRKLGTDMRVMIGAIETRQQNYNTQWPIYIHDIRPQIISLFIRAKNAGIWSPELFGLPAAAAPSVLLNYLNVVGTMLLNGHFREAKRMALQLKYAIEADRLEG